MTLTVEDCVYWAMVAGRSASLVGFERIARLTVSRDVDALRRAAACNLSGARADMREADRFEDWFREQLLAWRLCRSALAAIEADRSGR